MRVVLCAACKTVLGHVENDDPFVDARCQAFAELHREYCTATEEEYEQARYDLKFRQITKGLEL